MKGLTLCEKYYEAVGAPMIAARFPDYEGRIAVGLSGQGSDCLGYDDEYSRDHDFGPGFCLWLTDEDYDAIGAELQSAYAALPACFLGVERNEMAHAKNRVGVQRSSDFYRYFIGSPGAPESLMKWVRVQEHFLCTCTSGKVFRDDLGQFSAVRNALLPCYPEDVRLKKLAARAATMAQSGQYNFPRMMRRGDVFGARLALGEFLNAALSMMYLMDFRYEPYYKWQFHGAAELRVMGEALPYLKNMAASSTRRDDSIYGDIEAASAIAVRELRRQGLTDAAGDYLEGHAYSIMAHIQDETIKNLHVMEG
jgi:hypothetical protein